MTLPDTIQIRGLRFDVRTYTPGAQVADPVLTDGRVWTCRAHDAGEFAGMILIPAQRNAEHQRALLDRALADLVRSPAPTP